MKTDLLKDAIADADAIKKLAIENAKASLNEAFDSKIKSMLAAKLNEDADELEEKYDDEDEDKKMEEAKGEDDDSSDDDDAMKDDQDESFDIDAILAEMEDGDSSDDEMEEGKSEDDETEMEEGKSEDDDDDDQASDDETPKADEENLEEEIDLDALIAEMRGEDGEDDDGKKDADEAYSEDKEDDSMNEEDDPDADMLNKFKKFLKSQRKPKAEEPKKESIELQEIKRQAAELAKKVNETNLINAKLLYLNKVLRDHTLSEQQKLKVVAAFDKASSVKEAKIVYESLNEALKIKTTKGNKNMLKESLGFASKASGTSTKREIISEADQHVARWQKLAGIRK